MKKTIAICALLLAACHGKTASKEDRPLTNERDLEYQLIQSKLEQIQALADPLIKRRAAMTAEDCATVGVEADKISTECGLTNSGMRDQRGQPLAPRVWHVHPEPPKPPVKK